MRRKLLFLGLAMVALAGCTTDPAVDRFIGESHASAALKSDTLGTVRLLLRAITLARPALQNHDVALEGLARLSVLAGEPAAARRWATEGLERNPMNVSLAVLLRELGPSAPDHDETREAAA